MLPPGLNQPGVSAELAQLVERRLAKAKVAGSNPVFRSIPRGPASMAQRAKVWALLVARLVRPAPHGFVGFGAARQKGLHSRAQAGHCS
jgi:hypothetical protein